MKTNTANFLETLLFVADSPDHESRPFRDSTIHDFHPDFIAAVDSFIDGFRNYLATNHPNLDPDAGERSFGGNCYFSLSGHGCGFWDDSNSEYGKAMHAAIVAYSESLPGGGRYRFEQLEHTLSKRRGGKIDLDYLAKYLPAYRRRMFGMPEPVTPPRKGAIVRGPVLGMDALTIDGVLVATINAGKVSPSHGYYPRHPYARRVKAWAKRHGIAAPLY